MDFSKAGRIPSFLPGNHDRNQWAFAQNHQGHQAHEVDSAGC
jgi:hypothetical protein